MAPEIGYYGFSEVFGKIKDRLEKESGTEVVLDQGEYLTVMIHDGVREPSVIYPLSDGDGYDVGFRVHTDEKISGQLEQDLSDLKRAKHIK